MKFILLFIFFIPASIFGQAILSEQNNKSLQLLLKERKERFKQYTEHIDDKSGIFGNQSKKDIKNINEILKEIIRTDNKIILELDNLSDQTRLESQSNEFENKKVVQDLASLELQNRKYLAAIDTLNKQLTYFKSGEAGSKKTSSYKWVIIFFLLSTLVLLYLLIKSKKRTHEQ